MNTSDQGLSITGLLGAAPAVPPGAVKSAEKSDNSLKKEEFSSVLGAEQRRREGTGDQSLAQSGGAGDGVAADGVAVDAAQLRLFSGAVTGNSLPLAGESLPLTASPAVSAADSQLQGTEASTVLVSGEVATLEGEASIGLPGQQAADVDTLNTEPPEVLAAGAGIEADDLVLAATGLPETVVAAAAVAQPVAGPATAEQAGQWWEARSNRLHASVQRAAEGMPLGTAVVADGGEEMRGLEFAQRVSLAAQQQSQSGQGAEASSPARNGGGQAPTPLSSLIAGQAAQAQPAATSARLTSSDARALDLNPTSSTAALSAGLAGAADRQPAASVAQTAVPVEVGRQGWSEQVMQRVMWMSAQNISRADIALDPPELGPLQVRVSAHGDQMTVAFTSSHGVVRDALDQGLPRLRDLMEQQGLNLADVDVSDQQPQHQARDQGAEPGFDNAPASTPGEETQELAEASETSPAASAGATLVASTSLVDHFV